VSTRGHSDMRGLVTAGRIVRRERAAGLEIERDFLARQGIAHRACRGLLLTLPSPSVITGRSLWPRGRGVQRGSLSRTARDQHQPASSRAIAALAMTGVFFLSMNACQRLLSRRLPA
jgi:hypothetical protein